MAGKLTLTVSQLGEYIRRMLQLDPMLHGVELKGEISNLKFHQTGTLFFTLKDEQAAISCVMYAGDVQKLQSAPFEGMRAVVSGSVGLYVKGGQMQFYASTLTPQGVGVFYERLLALKDRLEREGLFDRERKLPIPAFPDTIGVVSSPTGAVIHDVMNVSFRRDPKAHILLCPVRVQGIGASDEVAEAIRILDRMDCVSVIIIARGGGSIEDLWTFNEETVVRAVADCSKPVVSAVGHETDVTLCDLAADLRAPTPSAAAECVVPIREETFLRLAGLKDALNTALGRQLEHRDVSLRMLGVQLYACRQSARMEAESMQLCRLKQTLDQAVAARLSRGENALMQRGRELDILSPYHVLSRGYAIVSLNGKPVKSCRELNAEEIVTLRFADGTAGAQILKREREENGYGSEKEEGGFL